MRIRLGMLAFCVVCLTGPCRLQAQQANVNLDYNPQKNTENLIPFSAAHNSPDVRDDGTVTFRLMAPAAKEVLLSGVAVLTALHEALSKHGIKHEYYVGGHAGHDWATWRNLLYYRFLPNLWRSK